MKLCFHNIKSLSTEQKYGILSEKGIYISGRTENEHTFNLYSIFCFYAEICFNLKEDCIQEINLFKNLEFLDPYLEEIVIPAISNS